MFGNGLLSGVCAVVCAVCACATAALGETVDLSLRVEQGTEFYSYRSEISKVEQIGADTGTVREIRNFDITLERGELDPLAKTQLVRVRYDNVYFSAQRENPDSEITYDGANPDKQSKFLKGTFDHVMGLVVEVTVSTETGEIISTNVPEMPGVTQRQGSLTPFVSVEGISETIGDLLTSRIAPGEAAVGGEWTWDRAVRMKGVNVHCPVTRTTRLTEASEGKAVMAYEGDIEVETGAYSLDISDKGLTGSAEWNTELGVLERQEEVIHVEMSGTRGTGEPIVVTLKREQVIQRL